MKLTCDLCGGALQMNSGAKDASCKNCGLCYSLEMLREKLNNRGVAPQEATPVTPAPQPVVEPEPQPVVPPAPQPIVPPAPQPIVPPAPAEETPLKPIAPQPAPQFIMPVDDLFATCLRGTVQQGCICVGETVYINEDYSKPYRVYRFDDDSATTHASAGEYARLFLVPNRRLDLKRATILTGEPNPVANAYRYSGSVEGYFADLLNTHFSDYTVHRQVDWPGLKIPVTFMLLKDNRPVLAILVFDSHDAKSRYQAEKASAIFGSAFVCCTHFYKDYRNDAPYVVDRIREALGKLPN